MPSYHLHAIVLRKTKLGETDVILALLAEDGRQVRAVAKGMRKPGSRLGGRLEPFSVVDLLLHTGRSLDVVSEAETVDAHAPLREDYDRSMAASVIADVLDKTAQEGQAEPRVFGLAQATLTALEAAPVAALSRVVTAFLVKALAMHGYRPELESCAECAEAATGGHRFSLEAGGVLCPECGEREAASLEFSEDGRVAIARMLGATMVEVTDTELPPATLRECFSLVRAFAAYHVPARMKALDLYTGEVMR